MSQLFSDGTSAIVEDPQMRALYERLARVTQTAIPILLLGETGVGKEVVADWVHRSSGRPRDRFVRINCAGLAESVVESELFGHERGAFTGAVQAREGLIEAADGGTFFLDEIGELGLRTQAKLLRVLETCELVRVGSTRVRRANVRFVAATHRDLPAMIARGEFRQDLYFRLNALTVDIPPLRQRKSEIIPLARMFLARAAARLERSDIELEPEVTAVLLEHGWPGNVRELRNVIDRAAAMSSESVIRVSALGLPASSDVGRSVAPAETSNADAGDMRAQLKAFERSQIVAALERTQGNQTRAAKLLGVSRRTLTKKLAIHGLGRSRRMFGRVADVPTPTEPGFMPS